MRIASVAHFYSLSVPLHFRIYPVTGTILKKALCFGEKAALRGRNGRTEKLTNAVFLCLAKMTNRLARLHSLARFVSTPTRPRAVCRRPDNSTARGTMLRHPVRSYWAVERGNRDARNNRPPLARIRRKNAGVHRVQRGVCAFLPYTQARTSRGSR